MAGNKGAVAIRMDIDNTSICFVTAHLAAGFANYEERNRDFKTINQGLRFQRNRSIDDHDAVIWLGDFNYRIGLANERARKLAAANDFGSLYENDQVWEMYDSLSFVKLISPVESSNDCRVGIPLLLRKSYTLQANIQVRPWN